MIISKIELFNFRIYKGKNKIEFNERANKNINIVAGKNGFGKTTFLTSLIWAFYGKLMSQVEDKYRNDIKTAGGYDNYLETLYNNQALINKSKNEEENSFYVEVELKDLLIPSIPCKSVTIRRTFNYRTKSEKLTLLIDGYENELTKEVGYEVFINDFILPREIAKFFFFDAEKIVSLAEAKTKSELRSISRAYSEVLGIKKYEDLKKNIESLLIKLRRKGVSKVQKSKLDELIEIEQDLLKLIEHNSDSINSINSEITLLRHTSDSLQEKLIREGNAITLEELKELKSKRSEYQEKSKAIKNELKKLLDLTPLVISGKILTKMHHQVTSESKVLYGALNNKLLKKEIEQFSKDVLSKMRHLIQDDDQFAKWKKTLDATLDERFDSNTYKSQGGKVLLDFSEEKAREFEAIYNNIKSTYLLQFNSIVQEEKNLRIVLNKTVKRIKQAEARKDNHLAQKYRDEKLNVDNKISRLSAKKENLIEESGVLTNKLGTHKRILSEYEKDFNLVEEDKKKYNVAQNLLVKINKIITKIKEDKKFSLQKSISLGLKKLMHKENFVTDVKVNLYDDVMDIDLLDKNGNIINKDTLSKGEQQLYATALLKALVDESGIKFPVFIDSPLQKFDKHHSKNIIKEFYPTISDQVVLFPLLEKELSESEYELLKTNLNSSYLIENTNSGSGFKKVPMNNLFREFKKAEDVYTY